MAPPAAAAAAALPLPPSSPSTYLSLDPLADLPPLDLPLPDLLPSLDLPDLASPPARPAAAPAPPPPPAPTPPPAELAARLASATAENRALRARIAALARENRALRAAARPRAAKPRGTRPPAPAQTLLCVLLVAGAFFTPPNLLSSSTAPSTSPTTYHAHAPSLPFTPATLPPPRALPRPADAAPAATPALRAPPSSLEYVLCRDAAAAASALTGCAAAGPACVSSPPRVLSLVVPASAVGLNATEAAAVPAGARPSAGPGAPDPLLAEVRAHLISVSLLSPGDEMQLYARDLERPYGRTMGRIISAVAEAAA